MSDWDSEDEQRPLRDEIERLRAELAAERERAERLETDRREAVENAEAIAAERDEARAERDAGNEWIQARASVLEELALVKAERDALRAALVKAGEAIKKMRDSEVEYCVEIGYGVEELPPDAFELWDDALTEIRKLTEPHADGTQKETNDAND